MRYLKGKSKQDVLGFIRHTAEIAQNSTCLRSKCGSVIVKDGEIIGEGFNSPPQNLRSQNRCLRKHELKKGFKSDKTCCIHAEQRAIMDALKRNAEKLSGSRLYFIRLNDKDEIAFAGKPYCTICSKMALDSGIKAFVLFHAEGIGVYDMEEYNDLSFSYIE